MPKIKSIKAEQVIELVPDELLKAGAGNIVCSRVGVW